MARIRITNSSHHGRVPLSLNGEPTFYLNIPKDGAEVPVPAKFLPLLTDSNIEYEIIDPSDGDDEAGTDARGDSGAVSAVDPEAGPGSLGTIDETSNAAMPATPPVASPTTPAPPEAPAKAEGDDGKEGEGDAAAKEEAPKKEPEPKAKVKRVRKAATKKAGGDSAKAPAKAK